jgi:hypothetical protein
MNEQGMKVALATSSIRSLLFHYVSKWTTFRSLLQTT